MCNVKIKKGGEIYFDEVLVNKTGEDFANILMSLLSFELEIEEDVKLSDFFEICSFTKEFIKDYFSEEYNRVSALASAAKLSEPVENLCIVKSLDKDNEKICFIVSTYLEEGDSSNQNISDLKIKLISELIDDDNLLKSKHSISFTLLDLMTAVFEQFFTVINDKGLIQ